MSKLIVGTNLAMSENFKDHLLKTNQLKLTYPIHLKINQIKYMNLIHLKHKQTKVTSPIHLQNKKIII